jgi:hypothetical protein
MITPEPKDLLSCGTWKGKKKGKSSLKPLETSWVEYMATTEGETLSTSSVSSFSNCARSPDLT